MEQLAANLTYNGVSGIPFCLANVVLLDESTTDTPEEECEEAKRAQDLLKRTLPPCRQTDDDALDAYIGKARHWMQSCFAQHSFCHKTPRFSRIYGGGAVQQVIQLDHESAMPTRLLHILGDVVKLVNVKDDVGVAEYITLSHRWGPNETCTTNTSNFEDLKIKGLVIANLPRTFRDAVVFTQGLGFDFIWIDSLCIIQDDKSDWSTEAPRMACVYGNSVCTISALDATNNDGGLFIADTDSRGGLDARAWVTQERMIPPRSLIFTRNTVIWECRQADSDTTKHELIERPHDFSLAATHPKALYTYFRDFRYSNLRIDYPNETAVLVMLQDVLENVKYGDLVSFARAWWTFVANFTPCQLTKKADKFLAMCGIANTALRAMHIDNFWGLWGSKIVLEELAWCVDPNGPPSSRPLQNGQLLAPTWSWACVAGGRIKNDVYFRDSDPNQQPVIDCKPWIKQPFSTSFEHELPYQTWQRITALRIELKGDLRAATITKRRTHSAPSNEDEEDNSIDNEPHHFEIEIEPNGRWSDHERYHFMPDDTAEFPLDVPLSVYTMQLFDHPPKRDCPTSTTDEHINVYLILQQLKPVAGCEGNVDPAQGQVVRFEYECHLPGYASHQGQAVWPVKFDPGEADTEAFLNQRTFHRLGLLEGRFAPDEMRPYWDISTEKNWKYFRLM